MGKYGKIPHLGARIFRSVLWTTFFTGGGYYLYALTKDMGTESNRKRLEQERLQGRGDQTPGKEQMMIDTILGKGPASLKELREETTKKRYRIAEEHATYAVSPEEQERIREQKLKELNGVAQNKEEKGDKKDKDENTK